MKRLGLITIFFAAVLLLPSMALATDPACGLGPAPECDGICPPGTTCFDGGGGCACVPSGGDACGTFSGPPSCGGECPVGEACVDNGITGCECVLTCGDAAAPLCDGLCPPGAACTDGGTFCSCVPSGDACGTVIGPPLCGGICPPFAPLCVDSGITGCVCDVVPTLSEWGIMGMSLLMFGGVIYLRRRRQVVQRT